MGATSVTCGGQHGKRPSLMSFAGCLKVVVVMIACLELQGATGQLTITAITPHTSDGGVDPTTPNTVIGTAGSHIASSLLASGTAAMLWGTVPQAAVDQACETMVLTGTHELTVHVDNSWGISEDLTVQVIAIGGCSTQGAEAVFTDNYDRKSAIVCEATLGCGVYMTGDDVDQLWRQGNNEEQLNDRRRIPLRGGGPLVGFQPENCASDGAIYGAATSVVSATACAGGLVLPVIGTVVGLTCVAGMVLANVAVNVGAYCSIEASHSCFPGDALVLTEGGGHKAMRDLVLGERVAVWSQGGMLGDRVAFDEIYAFGHKRRTFISEFVKLSLAPTSTMAPAASSTKTLELSAFHFVPTMSGKGKHVYRRAKDIRQGDVMLSMPSMHMASSFDAVQSYGNTTSSESDVEFNAPLVAYTVTGVSSTFKDGLFNPFTMSGTILVNGVVASVHSDWFLDTTFDRLGITHWLPTAYQIVLTPARLLYNVLDKARYATIYDGVDKSINFQKM